MPNLPIEAAIKLHQHGKVSLRSFLRWQGGGCSSRDRAWLMKSILALGGPWQEFPKRFCASTDAFRKPKPSKRLMSVDWLKSLGPWDFARCVSKKVAIVLSSARPAKAEVVQSSELELVPRCRASRTFLRCWAFSTWRAMAGAEKKNLPSKIGP